VPADKRPAIYEAIGLINEQLWIGHFEMWAASGLVLFRHAALLDTDSESMRRSTRPKPWSRRRSTNASASTRCSSSSSGPTNPGRGDCRRR